MSTSFMRWIGYIQSAVSMVILLLSVSATHAQQYDQNYLKWKAQQQARDSQLQQDPNYYLSKPTVSSQPKHNSANSRGTRTENRNVDMGQIHLNSAGLAELQQLNGIGEKKAQAILDYRQQHGRFQQIDELQNIKGIGPKLLQKNKGRIVL